MRSQLYRKYRNDQAKLKKAYEAREWYVLPDRTGIEYVCFYKHANRYAIIANGVSAKGVGFQAALLDSGNFWFQYCFADEEIKAKQIASMLNQINNLLYEEQSITGTRN